MKDDDQSGSFSVKSGFYTADSAENQITAAGNYGFPFGTNGFVNLSGEVATSEPTTRSVQHGDATALIGQGYTGIADPVKPWGSPKVSDSVKFVVNSGTDVSDTSELYAFGNYTTRKVETSFFYRSPMNRNGVYKTSDNLFLVGGAGCQAQYNVPSIAENVRSFRETLLADTSCFWFGELYPEGFVPEFGAVLTDTSAVAGMRGLWNDKIFYDISLSTGSNSMDGYLNNTLNPSMGPHSPRDFEIGEYEQVESNFNIDLSRVYEMTNGANLNLAGGFEHRNEQFQIHTGEPNSWMIGDYQQWGFGTGSNGFGGFNPASSGVWDRSNVAGYLDVEVSSTSNAKLGGALRYEDFDGFGSTLNFKLAARFPVGDDAAIRGSFGSGFRAPTPGQSNARNVSTVVNAATNAFEERGTIGSTHPVAVALGGRELEPEESLNLTLGAIYETPIGATITVDLFNIDIASRIALSGLTTVTDEIKAALVSQGVPEALEFTSVRYFTNDFDTSTWGVDVVVTHSWEAMDGTNDVLLTLNNTKTSVDNWRAGSTIVDGDTIDNLERGAPETRIGVNYQHTRDQWDITARYNFYGPWYDDHSAAEFDGYGLFDVLGTYEFTNALSLMVGIENLLDTYPEETINYGNGRLYPRYSPAGYNGRLVFGAISFDF